MVTFWGKVKPGLKFEMDRLQTFQVEYIGLVGWLEISGE